MTPNNAGQVCTRRKWGRGFQYLDADNEKLLCQEQLKRIKSLAVPPMWRSVEIALNPKAKIQATGRDAKDRKQYIYSEAWQKKQQNAKFKHLVAFAKELPSIREQCHTLIKQQSAQKDKVLALMVLILDETGIRIGNQRYTQENNTHGLTTLRSKHLVDDDAGIKFEFVGKSGKSREVLIEDTLLGEHIKTCAQHPGYNIFRYKGEGGKWQDICSEDLNEFIQSLSVQRFTAKDFRTWNGTCFAVHAYHYLGNLLLESKKKPINQVVDEVAKKLGNTPTICREYYIHPKVFKALSKVKLPFKPQLLNETSTSDTHYYSLIEEETLKMLCA